MVYKIEQSQEAHQHWRRRCASGAAPPIATPTPSSITASDGALSVAPACNHPQWKPGATSAQAQPITVNIHANYALAALGIRRNPFHCDKRMLVTCAPYDHRRSTATRSAMLTLQGTTLLPGGRDEFPQPSAVNAFGVLVTPQQLRASRIQAIRSIEKWIDDNLSILRGLRRSYFRRSRQGNEELGIY